MRWTRISVALAAAALLNGGEKEAKPAKPSIPEPYDSIVRLAYGCPPEFAADVLLRLVEAGRIPDKQTRAELVERAFSLAASAQLRTPVTAITKQPDTPAAMQAAASRLGLDALTLQSRAVRDMRPIDPKKAYALFLAIPPPALKQPSCADLVIPDISPLRNLASEYGAAQTIPAPPALPDCSQDPGLKDVLRDTAYWQSDKGARLFQEAFRLRFNDLKQPISDADRNTREWLQQLTDFLKDLGDWNASDEKSEAAFYHQKCIIFEMLAEITPPGPDRDKVVSAFVDFIANSNLEREWPAEWFSHAASLITRIRATSTGDPAKVVEVFRASGNPVLALYGDLDRAFAAR